MKPLFKASDTVRLKSEYVERVMNHEKVFLLYHEVGTPREWIVSLCNGTPMRVMDIDQDLSKKFVLTLRTDPREVVWQQEWFELVSHDVIGEMSDMEEEWFKID